MQSESEKQKTKWFFASLAAFALVINWRFALPSHQFGVEPLQPIVAAPKAPVEPWHAPSIITGNGAIRVTTSGSQEFQLEEGEGYGVALLNNVSLEKYFNGQHIGTIQAGVITNEPMPPALTYPINVSFRLIPNQGLAEARIGYIKYRGSEAPPDWYKRASAAALSGVLFSDDFKSYTIDPSKWTVSGHEVYQQSGTIYVETAATDAGGDLTSSPIAVNGSGLITITRKVSLHYGNEFFDGEFGMKIGSMPECAVRYAHMAQSTDPKYRASEGFFLTKDDSKPNIINDAMNVSQPVAPIWDSWFNEKITYDPKTGHMEYFINDVKQQNFFVGIPPYTDALSMQLHFTAWGWYTGHEHLMKNLKVTQEPSGS